MKRITFTVLAVLVAVSVVSAAHAEADLGFKGIGGKLNIVFPDAEGIDNAIGFGVMGDFGTIIPELSLQGTIDFWSKSEGPVSFRDIAIGARTTYTFPLDNASIKPYAAGGLAIHLLKVEVDAPSYDFGFVTYGGGVEDTDTKIGLDLAGGALFTVSDNMDILGEAMIRIVSDVTQFVISGGVVYWFGE
jgi:opacity protein-like surface antigen